MGAKPCIAVLFTRGPRPAGTRARCYTRGHAAIRGRAAMRATRPAATLVWGFAATHSFSGSGSGISHPPTVFRVWSFAPTLSLYMGSGFSHPPILFPGIRIRYTLRYTLLLRFMASHPPTPFRVQGFAPTYILLSGFRVSHTPTPFRVWGFAPTRLGFGVSHAPTPFRV